MFVIHAFSSNAFLVMVVIPRDIKLWYASLIPQPQKYFYAKDLLFMLQGSDVRGSGMFLVSKPLSDFARLGCSGVRSPLVPIHATNYREWLGQRYGIDTVLRADFV